MEGMGERILVKRICNTGAEGVKVREEDPTKRDRVKEKSDSSDLIIQERDRRVQDGVLESCDA